MFLTKNIVRKYPVCQSVSRKRVAEVVRFRKGYLTSFRSRSGCGYLLLVYPRNSGTDMYLTCDMGYPLENHERLFAYHLCSSLFLAGEI